MFADESDSCYTLCPYCGYAHGDCAEYNNDEEPNITECYKCKKKFWQWAEYSVDYCASKLENEP